MVQVLNVGATRYLFPEKFHLHRSLQTKKRNNFGCGASDTMKHNETLRDATTEALRNLFLAKFHLHYVSRDSFL